MPPLATPRARITGIVARVRTLSPATILALGWVALLLHAFPGQTTWASLRTLLEARNGVYTDLGTPAMASLWSWVDHVIAGTFGMLLLQSASLLAGFYLIFVRVLAPRPAAATATALAVFPPVLMPIGFIWEESLMAAFMALGIGGLLSPRRGLRIVGLAALFGASAVRADAFVATLPPVLLLFRWGDHPEWLVRYGTALLAWLGILLASWGLNHALAMHPTHDGEIARSRHDIVGTLAFVEHDVPDAELLAILEGTELRVRNGVHATARRVYSAKDAGRVTRHSTDAMWPAAERETTQLPAAQRAALERARVDLRTTHPTAYLRHRVAVTAQLLWIGTDRAALAPARRNFNNVDLLHWNGLTTGWTEVQRGTSALFSVLATRTPLFAPWLYVALALVLLPFARRHRDIAAVLASGLGLVGWLAFHATGRDYRFTHWMVVCACIGAIVLVARRRAGTRYEDAPTLAAVTLGVWLRTLPARGRAVLTGATPRAILVIGLLGIVLYAFPGYMSYDSVYQLAEARSGVYSDGHPPAMAVLWRALEMLVAGPFGILILQNVSFLAGCYLILRRRMSDRAAAIVTVAVLWFPVTASTMAVIWKDSVMTGFLMLGTGLLLGERRRDRVLGLVVLTLATAMRHNALAMTLPIVVLAFVWDPAHRWWKRYALSILAWITLTATAQLATRALTTVHWHMWHQSLALLDMAGTIRYADELSDEQLRQALAGVRLRVTHDLQAHTRAALDPRRSDVDQLWDITRATFEAPSDEAERTAVARAWKAIVLGHPRAYLTYRWHVFRHLVQLHDLEPAPPIYRWFTDVQDPYGAARKIAHSAAPSQLQVVLGDTLVAIATTPLFKVYVYLLLALALLPFALRDRDSLALLLSALSSEAALYFLTPTTDFRYSFWMIVSTVLATALLIARRAGTRRPARAG